MRIGLPKIRLSKKLMVAVLGGFVLCGGTAAAALVFGTDALLGPPEETIVGGECVNIQTVVVRTPSNRFWLRKFVRMDNSDGPTRIRTAMRVAGLLAHDNPVDLIHVSIIDSKGPEKRADMRARAIGAEVLFALNPANVPELKQPIVAKYVEGAANAEGRFYGDKVELSLDDIRSMMTAMKDVEDKADCLEPVVEGEDKAKGQAGEHQAAKEPADVEDPAIAGKSATEGEHGTPARDAHVPVSTSESADPAVEPSFFGRMLAMVGLGADARPAVGEHAGQPAGHPGGVDAAAGEEAVPADEGEHVRMKAP